jgi:hypothetical protein
VALPSDDTLGEFVTDPTPMPTTWFADVFHAPPQMSDQPNAGGLSGYLPKAFTCRYLLPDVTELGETVLHLQIDHLPSGKGGRAPRVVGVSLSKADGSAVPADDLRFVANNSPLLLAAGLLWWLTNWRYDPATKRWGSAGLANLSDLQMQGLIKSSLPTMPGHDSARLEGVARVYRQAETNKVSTIAAVASFASCSQRHAQLLISQARRAGLLEHSQRSLRRAGKPSQRNKRKGG